MNESDSEKTKKIEDKKLNDNNINLLKKQEIKLKVLKILNNSKKVSNIDNIQLINI